MKSESEGDVEWTVYNDQIILVAWYSHDMEPDHALASNIQMLDIPTMIHQMIRESQGLTNDDCGISKSHTPFTDDIFYVESPRRLRMPSLSMYEGNSDPNQHILKYKWLMNATRADDAVKCKSFPISLGGIATMWFTRLPPRSISCFD